MATKEPHIRRASDLPNSSKKASEFPARIPLAWAAEYENADLIHALGHPTGDLPLNTELRNLANRIDRRFSRGDE
jgi:hypothetical protein